MSGPIVSFTRLPIRAYDPNRAVTKWAGFFVTVNSNRRVTNNNNLDVILDNVMADILENENDYFQEPIKVGKKVTGWRDIPKSKIIRKNLTGGAQIGNTASQGGRVHYHAKIAVEHTHTGKLYINGSTLKEMVIQQLNDEGIDVSDIHLDIKYSSVDGNMENYIMKGSQRSYTSDY